MKQIVVRYRTKPESTEANSALIQKVFKELHAGPPKNLRYLVLRLEDGSFLHIVVNETDGDGSPLRQVEAFQAFQSGIKERLASGPESTEMSIVGSYRMLDQHLEARHSDAA
jgi:hypothetical protein